MGFYSNTQEVTGISSLGCRSLKASIGTLDSFKHKISTETKIQGICCRCASWLEIKMKIEGFKFNIKKIQKVYGQRQFVENGHKPTKSKTDLCKARLSVFILLTFNHRFK